MIRHGVRIAFTGAGGTGKTSTAYGLSSDLDIPIIKSASRVVYEEDDLTEEKCMALSNEDKYKLQFRIFEKKIELDNDNFSFIADRTLLDHWAYCLMYCGAFMPNDAFAEFEERVRVHMLTSYSHIFYFPFGYWFAEGDGVRQDHHAWQSAIDAIIVGYLRRWSVPVAEVPQTKGQEFRAKFVNERVRRPR